MMSQSQTSSSTASDNTVSSISKVANKSMDEIVALCRRRGFIWQSSEIYGGINGFWDYGPLGTALKRNLKNAWWNDIVKCSPDGPDGHPLQIVGVDCTIIMNPKVWEASGHVGGFNDPMITDKKANKRFRTDQLFGMYLRYENDDKQATQYDKQATQLDELIQWAHDDTQSPIHGPNLTCIASGESEAFGIFQGILCKTRLKIEPINVSGYPFAFRSPSDEGKNVIGTVIRIPDKILKEYPGNIPSPTPSNLEIIWLRKQMLQGNFPPNKTENKDAFPLKEPKEFNLMFDTYTGAVRDEDSKTYLRPETAQGIFTQFWNVVDTSRVKIPFGIAQIGKAFRNEVTPRNFTFRSREFEQMELEYFIHPDEANDWYKYWCNSRYAWWQSIGLAGANLQLREHEKDELAHYAKEGAGTSDIEYRFPFTAPGYGELEGVAHRADYDLKAHAEKCGKGKKLRYFDQGRNEHYFPHVIEPSGGADRGTLAVLCEAYTPDPARPSKVFMKFHPRMAPIKAAIFPLVNKDGMPEVAEKLYKELRQTYEVQYDFKQNIGKRYARMDEAGTPYCFTVDSDTLTGQTVTVRERDTTNQERINIDNVSQYLKDRIG